MPSIANDDDSLGNRGGPHRMDKPTSRDDETRGHDAPGGDRAGLGAAIGPVDATTEIVPGSAVDDEPGATVDRADIGDGGREVDPWVTDPRLGTTADDIQAPVGRPIGVVIPGYEILGELGRGGMGVVYKARQIQLNRPCALKMILAGAHADAQADRPLPDRGRGRRPAAAPEHRADLRDRRGRRPALLRAGVCARRQPGPAARRHALAAAASGAGWSSHWRAAIAEAHARAIVHRDLKPANVLLTADGTPKITDFGLAKWLGSDSGLTRTESIMGTPSYMAPEQAGGKTREVGPAADVYALGAILYELLTGRPPFRGTTVLETLEQVKSAEPVPPSRLVPGLPRDLETICLKCLQKEPGKRYDIGRGAGRGPAAVPGRRADPGAAGRRPGAGLALVPAQPGGGGPAGGRRDGPGAGHGGVGVLRRPGRPECERGASQPRSRPPGSPARPGREGDQRSPPVPGGDGPGPAGVARGPDGHGPAIPRPAGAEAPGR